MSDSIRVVAEGLPLGDGHENQERVVEAALRRLQSGQRGIVLADEVGFGKTYEALAVISTLCAYETLHERPFDRVLVLCKKALTGKWAEETSATRQGKGFPRYLPNGHPAEKLFKKVRCVDTRLRADQLRHVENVRGQRSETGESSNSEAERRIQVPPGLYIVNERLLLEEQRREAPLLRQLWRTRWDAVVVDEAHHYARGNKPSRLFSPNGDLSDYMQGGLEFGKILALTATPFELTPRELIDLLALIRVDRTHLDVVQRGLENFVQALDRFFDLRQRSPEDILRREKVALLKRLRDEDALNAGATDRGLQGLLRQYLLRNTKSQNERQYRIVSRSVGGFSSKRFQKLDQDLQEVIRTSPLIPFEGAHALFYLELRGLIQEAADQARDGTGKRTFVATDLRQGLSSYPQVKESALLARESENAKDLKKLVDEWSDANILHPKVSALVHLVRGIAEDEVEKVRANSNTWFSKVLIFNKMIKGTAPQLKKELELALDGVFSAFADELLHATGRKRDDLDELVRRTVERQLDAASVDLANDAKYGAWSTITNEFADEHLARHKGKSLLWPFRERLPEKARQSLALIDLLRGVDGTSEESIADWLDNKITRPTVEFVKRVIDRYLDDTPDADAGSSRAVLVEGAERDLLVQLEESSSIELVGRFDGSNGRTREAHRRNFNQRHNPFVLLVGQVGEEGIDLQQQCRYVIHYDLEWNPARMEQREGRVDRIGWGRADEAYIDVRFLLLKGTYEERIFHTVMQRDQWFQVLIGSKKKELGQCPTHDPEEEVAQDAVDDAAWEGGLTDEEKRSVMLDLRP